MLTTKRKEKIETIRISKNYTQGEKDFFFFFFFFNGIQYKTGIRRAFFLKSTHKASIITLNVLGIKI